MVALAASRVAVGTPVRGSSASLSGSQRVGAAARSVARANRAAVVKCQATATVDSLITKEGWFATDTVQGTSRAQNEDRFAVMVLS